MLPFMSIECSEQPGGEGENHSPNCGAGERGQMSTGVPVAGTAATTTDCRNAPASCRTETSCAIVDGFRPMPTSRA
jgi:hypothetical protein